MVTEWGMSDALGPAPSPTPTASPRPRPPIAATSLGTLIDDEVHALIDEAHARARAILESNRATLDRLAAALIERETLDEDELAEVFGDAADPGPPAIPDPVSSTAHARGPGRPTGCRSAPPPRCGSAVASRDRLGAWRRTPDVPEGLA